MQKDKVLHLYIRKCLNSVYINITTYTVILMWSRNNFSAGVEVALLCSFYVRLDQHKLMVLLWVSRSGNIFSSRLCLPFENQILLSSSCEHSVIDGLRFTSRISKSWMIFPKKNHVHAIHLKSTTCVFTSELPEQNMIALWSSWC